MHGYLSDAVDATCFHDLLSTATETGFETYESTCGDTAKIAQLSPGSFRGRVLSANAGRVCVRLERCNQVVEKEVSCDADVLVFNVCADKNRPRLSYNGMTDETDWVFVQPPNAKSVLISPASSIQLTVEVSYQFLLNHLDSMPEISDRIKRLKKNGEFLRSNLVANRLRDIGRIALDCSQREPGPEERHMIESNLVLGLVTGLTLAWLPLKDFETYQRPSALSHFQSARRLLLKRHDVLTDKDPRKTAGLGSRRTIEKAFSELIDMGPVMYARVLRLNRARKKIHDGAYFNRSIGDIAAEEGFWDWSRFTSYYRKQFGELPSETRSRQDRMIACA